VFGSDAGWSKVSEAENQPEADEIALKKILAHRDIYKSYLQDLEDGRAVLFLKYEEYYDDPVARIRKISDFLEMDPPLSDYEISILCDYTKIDKNIERASRMKSFNDERDPNTGMQAGHVDKSTRGMPGALMTKHPAFVHAVNNENNNLKPLKELCDVMGYELPQTYEKLQFNTNNEIKILQF